jgi:hypothetical protein
MDVPITDSTSDVDIIITGGFRDFDSCGVFDCLNGNDLVQIYVDSGGYGSGFYGVADYGDMFHY